MRRKPAESFLKAFNERFVIAHLRAAAARLQYVAEWEFFVVLFPFKNFVPLRIQFLHGGKDAQHVFRCFFLELRLPLRMAGF